MEQHTGKRLPGDPFSGEPFGYRARDRGFVLYSVGPDLRDDGGTEPTKGEQAYDKGDIVLEWTEDAAVR